VYEPVEPPFRFSMSRRTKREKKLAEKATVTAVRRQWPNQTVEKADKPRRRFL
jgi:hypothetical protein